MSILIALLVVIHLVNQIFLTSQLGAASVYQSKLINFYNAAETASLMTEIDLEFALAIIDNASGVSVDVDGSEFTAELTTDIGTEVPLTLTPCQYSVLDKTIGSDDKVFFN